MRLELPRRFEFDSADVILAMVGAGLGWAVVTPLSIFEVKARLPKIRMLPIPGPGFSRHLDLVSRAGEIDVLAGRIAALSRRILRNRYLPEMLRLAPWLNGKVHVGSADGAQESE
jgi:DNA-binding transcriptional LysR family regulator